MRPTWLAAVHSCGTYDHAVPHAWSKVFEWLDRGMHHTVPGRGFGLTFDDPRSVPADGLRYLAGVAVPDTWRPCDKNLVARHFFDGGAYTLRRHQGPYSELEQAISRCRDGWEPQHGLEFDDSRPIVTLYWSDTRSVEPENQIADICLPVLEKTSASE